MHKLSLVISAAVMALASSATAQAGQWYVGANAGAVIQNDTTYSGNDPDGSTWSNKGSFDTGYGLMANAGYNFGGPKAELEVAYRSAGHKSLSDISNPNVSGDLSSLAIMANGIYEFLPKSSWHPFLGAGIGVANVSDDMKGADGSTYVNDSDWQFAYQAIAGVSYDINKSWAINAQYRYFATLDPSITNTDGNKTKMDYSNHNILAGLTYKFSE